MKTTEAQHTKGPWSIVDCDNDGYHIINPNIPGKHIATVSIDDMDPDECRVNAALLRTAPELLEALMRVRDAFYVEGTSKALRQAFDGTKEIVAKALGNA